MENIYSAFTKVINNTTFYFVKRYSHFPDLKGVPDALEGFGMHSDFDKACAIALINDEAIRQQLWLQVQPMQADSKVIEMTPASQEQHHLKNWLSHLHPVKWLPIAK